MSTPAIEDTPLHPREHLDVLIVGAGLSGIGAAHYLQAECPWARYAIFEARDSIGGTWDLFRYPGIRSDSDMHTLGYSFRPWDGEKSIADGDSILQYIKDTAAEDGIDRHIRFGHRIVAAEWSGDDARWRITAKRGDDTTVELTASFLFSCTGYYRYDHGYLPDFDGMSDFAGTLVHPQHWPEDLDYIGKRVVVVGSGATAVTLVPALARSAAHVTMLQRSPTYIASLPQRSPMAKLFRKVLPKQKAGTAAKWAHALMTQSFYALSRRYPQQVKRFLRKGLERELPAGYDIDTHFTPRYNPWDQRFCAVPDGDLFKAIRDGGVSVVTDTIERFTKTGVLLASGQRAPGGHRRHGHRPRAPLPRGHRAHRRRRSSRSGEPAHLQGHDDRRGSQPGRRHRLHERLVDTQVRSHMPVRLPAPHLHARPRLHRVRASQQRSLGVRRAGRCSGSPRATSSARPTCCPSKVLDNPGRCTRATCATTDPCA